jgi:hypothetical protein
MNLIGSGYCPVARFDDKVCRSFLLHEAQINFRNPYTEKNINTSAQSLL